MTAVSNVTKDVEFVAALARVLGPLYSLTLTDGNGEVLATFGRSGRNPSSPTDKLPLPGSSNVLSVVVDVRALEAADRVIHSLTGSHAYRVPHLDDALDHLVAEGETHIGKDISSMSRAEKQQLVAFLDDRGAFALRKAVEQVADHLKVSRFTVYNYLDSVRGG